MITKTKLIQLCQTKAISVVNPPTLLYEKETL